MGRNSRCARLWISEMEIGDTVVGVGTEDISVADWLAELSQKPKPIAASPAATTTPISVRIFETLLHRAGNELPNFCVEKKGNTPDPSRLFEGSGPRPIPNYHFNGNNKESLYETLSPDRFRNFWRDRSGARVRKGF